MVAALRSFACAALLCSLPVVARAEVDPWFGRDKWLHFGASAALGAGGYAIGSAFLEERPARVAFGSGLALSAGIAKELADLAGAGHPSWRDLAWDAVGTGIGVLLAFGVDELFFTPGRMGGGKAQAHLIAVGGRF